MGGQLSEFLAQYLNEKRIGPREAARITGRSPGYIRNLVLGHDAKTLKPWRPSPDALRDIAKLGIPYIKLMELAGYLRETDFPPGVLRLLDNPRNAAAFAEILSEPGPKKLVVLSALELAAEKDTERKNRPES